MSKQFMLNRKHYLQLKKMDHSQMSAWAESVYRSGYKDGKDAAEGLNSDEIREALVYVKGIGEKRIEDIVAALEKAMEEKMNGV